MNAVAYSTQQAEESFRQFRSSKPVKRNVTPSRPLRRRRAQTRKKVGLAPLLRHGLFIGGMLLIASQLAFGATQLAVKLSLLDKKIPEAEWMHEQIVNEQEQLKNAIAQVDRPEGVEKLAREQLGFAASNEILVRLL